MTTPHISEIQSHVDSAIKEFRRSKPNCAETFVAMSRRLEQIPGVTKHTAMKVARDNFPGSYRAYCLAQETGTAPVLFPKPDYAKRLAAMVANGGKLN